MNAITFEQFINTFNFRHINECVQYEEEQYDTKIIRIYIDGEKYTWFEFGVYDFGMHTFELVRRCLNDKICKSYIDSITYDERIGVLKIYLRENSEL